MPPFEAALEFAEKIKDLPGISIKGLLYYNGLIYSETTLEGYITGTKKEHDELIGTANLLKQHGYTMEILSGGNSYSSKCCRYLEGITEVRCGNYIFNDVSALATGFATEEECALKSGSYCGPAKWMTIMGSLMPEAKHSLQIPAPIVLGSDML